MYEFYLLKKKRLVLRIFLIVTALLMVLHSTAQIFTGKKNIDYCSSHGTFYLFQLKNYRNMDTIPKGDILHLVSLLRKPIQRKDLLLFGN